MSQSQPEEPAAQPACEQCGAPTGTRCPRCTRPMCDAHVAVRPALPSWLFLRGARCVRCEVEFLHGQRWRVTRGGLLWLAACVWLFSFLRRSLANESWPVALAACAACLLGLHVVRLYARRAWFLGQRHVLRAPPPPQAGPTSPAGDVESLHRQMSDHFHAGRIAEAASVGETSWRQAPRPLTAYNMACCRARLGQLDEALGWLERAVEAGFPRTGKHLDDDTDFDALRALPRYVSLRAQLP